MNDFPDRTDEFRKKLEDADWIKQQNRVWRALDVSKNLQNQLDCINSSVGPLGGKIINPNHSTNGMPRVSVILKNEINDDFCYVTDVDNGGYKYSKNFIDEYFKNNSNLLYVQMIYGGYDRYSLNDSSQINFNFHSARFGSNRNVKVEYDYDNHDPSVEGADQPVSKEINDQQVCQLNYELLGDWQFIGGETNSPPYVWVDSEDKFIEERNDLDSYFQATNYNYKLICKSGELNIDPPKYLNYSIDRYQKNKTYFSLSVNNSKVNNFILNLEQKATCQMFVYFKTNEIGFDPPFETEDVYVFSDGLNGRGHKISKDRVIKIDLGLGQYSKRQRFGFLFFNNPTERTFTNKIQLHTSQLKDCKQVETIEKPTQELQDEPPKQENEAIETNPSTGESEYNQSKPQLKFLENNKDILIDDFKRISSFIYGYDEDGLVSLKYQWSDSPNKTNDDYTFLKICSNKTQMNNGNAVAILNGSKSILTSAQVQKPTNSGKYYLYVCLKDKHNNIVSGVAYYNIIKDIEPSDGDLDSSNNDDKDENNNKIPRCTNEKINWCDSAQGPIQGSINPCCQGINLIECKKNNLNYSIETIESNSNKCQ